VEERLLNREMSQRLEELDVDLPSRSIFNAEIQKAFEVGVGRKVHIGPKAHYVFNKLDCPNAKSQRVDDATLGATLWKEARCDCGSRDVAMSVVGSHDEARCLGLCTTADGNGNGSIGHPSLGYQE